MAAFRSLYDDINQYAQPGRETPESMQPGYTSPAIRAMGAQRWKPRTGTPIPSIGSSGEWYGYGPRPPTPSQPIPEHPYPLGGKPRVPATSATQTQYQEPKLTPFMRTFLSNVQTMDEEQRGEYFDTLSASIKDRMDRWSYRIARGIPLTANQQTQYNSLRGAFNDIQSYLSNQSGYDEYLRKMGGISPVAQAGQQY